MTAAVSSLATRIVRECSAQMPSVGVQFFQLREGQLDEFGGFVDLAYEFLAIRGGQNHTVSPVFLVLADFVFEPLASPV